MSREVEIRKHVEVALSFNNPGTTSISFERNITLDFIPDEMIVRQICYRPIVTESDVYMISSDLTNGPLGVFFIFPNFVKNETVFIMRRPVIGMHQFTIKKQPETNIIGQGNLALHLEFVKYT